MVQEENKTGTKVINSIFVLSHDKICEIQAAQTVSYIRIVVDYHQQKSDSIRVTQFLRGGT